MKGGPSLLPVPVKLLAAGLQQVVNQRLYSKLIVTRALIPHSRDIGALPGTKDEARNLTKENIKTIITRAGIGSKIVLTGDIQQIDNYRLTATSNGFVTLIESFKNQNLFAHITLSRTERSRLAALGVELLP